MFSVNQFINPLIFFHVQVGNAVTDDYYDQFGLFQFMWSAGLISDQTYKQLNLLCDFESFEHPSEVCDKTYDIAYEELGNIDPYSIFTPACTGNFSLPNRLLKRWHVSINILDGPLGHNCFKISLVKFLG